MKRLFLIIPAICVVLLTGVLLAPSFMNWNKYKGQILAHIQSTTGLEAEIGGNIAVSLLPAPSLEIEQLRLTSPMQTKNPRLLSLDSLEAHLSLAPLLTGKIVVEEVVMQRPSLFVEVLNDGEFGWKTLEIAKKMQGSGESETLQESAQKKQESFSISQALSFRTVKIIDGSISYYDHRSDAQKDAQALQATIQADTLMGPYGVTGEGVYEDRTYQFQVETKDPFVAKAESLSLRAKIALPDAAWQTEFLGIVAIGNSPEAQGEIIVKPFSGGEEAGAFNEDNAAPLLASNTKLKGFLTFSADKLSITDVEVVAGEAKGSGKIALQGFAKGNKAIIDSEITIEGPLNLDTLLVNQEKTNQKDKSKTYIPSHITLPLPIEGSVVMNIEKLTYAGQDFKGVIIESTLKDKEWQYKSKVLEAPGKTQFDSLVSLKFKDSEKSDSNKAIIYKNPVLSFNIEGDTKQLPTLLRSLPGQDSQNPSLEHFKEADIHLVGAIEPQKFSLKESVVKLDETTFGLNIEVSPGKKTEEDKKQVKPQVLANITVDKVDVDSMIKRQKNAESNAVQEKTQQPQQPMQDILKAVQTVNLPVNVTFDVSVQEMIVAGETAKGVRIKGDINDKSLTLNPLTVNRIKSSNIRLKTILNDRRNLGGIEINLATRTKDFQSLLSLIMGKKNEALSKIAYADLQISTKGNINKLALKSTLKAIKGSASVKGVVVDLLDKPDIKDIEVSINHPDLDYALSILGNKKSSALRKGVGFKVGTKVLNEDKKYRFDDFKASLGKAVFTGALKADMSAGKPYVTGDISFGDLNLNSLLSKAKTSSSKRAQNQNNKTRSSATQEQFSQLAIDTSWMHNFNSDLSFKGKSLQKDRWYIKNPTAAFRLKDGSMEIADVTGSVFGGSLIASVNAQSPVDPKKPLTFQNKTTLENVDLEKLAGALSGSETLKATGTVSLDSSIQSAGISSSSLMNNLKGSASVDGRNFDLLGFDLTKMARGLSADSKIATSLDTILNASLEGGSTRFDTIKGSYQIVEGLVRTEDTLLEGPSAKIQVQGKADLVSRNMALLNTITFKDVSEDVPPLTVSIEGDLSNPGSTLAQGVLNDYINRKFQRKVSKELTNILGGVLGSGSTSNPSSNTAPNNGSKNRSSAPTQNDLNSTPQKEQKDPLDAEDAIRGVLEGLLGGN